MGNVALVVAMWILNSRSTRNSVHTIKDLVHAWYFSLGRCRVAPYLVDICVMRLW